MHVSEFFFHNFYSVISWYYSSVNFSWDQCSMQCSCQLFILFKPLYFYFKWLFFYFYNVTWFLLTYSCSSISFLSHLVLCDLWMRNKHPYRLTYLNTWTPVSSNVWGNYRTFRRLNLAEANTSLEDGGRLWGYVVNLLFSLLPVWIKYDHQLPPLLPCSAFPAMSDCIIEEL